MSINAISGSNYGSNWRITRAFHASSVDRRNASAFEGAQIKVNTEQEKYGNALENKELRKYVEEIVGGSEVSEDRKVNRLEKYIEKLSEQIEAGEGEELDELEGILGKNIDDAGDLKDVVASMAGQAGVLDNVYDGASKDLAQILQASKDEKIGEYNTGWALNISA
ncbi:hypothetical protein HNV12_01940 [Methanococcoides sp. SA1]|nr:hypothetical protein [Methanococcoides sp. SA1]